MRVCSRSKRFLRNETCRARHNDFPDRKLISVGQRSQRRAGKNVRLVEECRLEQRDQHRQRLTDSCAKSKFVTSFCLACRTYKLVRRKSSANISLHHSRFRNTMLFKQSLLTSDHKRQSKLPLYDILSRRQVSHWR